MPVPSNSVVFISGTSMVGIPIGTIATTYQKNGEEGVFGDSTGFGERITLTSSGERLDVLRACLIEADAHGGSRLK